MKKERILWADIVRIAAVYLVLVGHTAYLDFNVSRVNIIYWISFAVVKICVPLFVMLSGGLLLGKQESYGLFYKKRASRYLLPWIFWAVITAVLSNLRGGNGINSGFIELLKTSILSFWFLPMLTCLYILTPSIRKYLKVAKPFDIVFILILWFLAISYLPFTINNPAFPLFIDNSLLTQTVRFSGYYILGFLLTKYNWDKKLNLKILMFIFILGLGYVTMMTLKNPVGELYFNYHSPGVILESISGFLLIKKLVEHYERKFGKRFKGMVTDVSIASYGIYLSHLVVKGFLTNFFRSGFLDSRYVFTNYAKGLILFVVCFLVISILKKLPLVGKISG